MKTINIHEAKTHLSRIIERVARGESVIIGKAGKPVAVLSPYVALGQARKPGSMQGKIRIADDFDAADAVIADLFEGAAGSR
ncbi:type II toxin-antitoxin system Phd/YefM family antitoxin [Nitrococcus mobilis]|uniref:Antitoxin n=1 Tax=Nitrococcus mobilis Nb-231 TaxID=314278 RepID=A4BLZ6_9GAMM|nr:type II toxin-antitoxin system prevent-host-death family antitoxin [Nitrococcus mobilis]EAR23334.1 Prevent-host-death protein [Nitrococcus mobilis Nb-231]